MTRLAVAICVLSSLAASVAPNHVSGVWRFDFERDASGRWLLSAPDSSECTLKQEGRTLTGTCGSDAIHLMGVVNGRRISFQVEADSAATLTAEVNEAGTRMKGTWRLPDRFGKFTATKRVR